MSSSTYDPSSAFHAAAEYVSTSPSLKKLSNETKLELYGLYKLVTAAREPSGPRPGMLSFEGRAKWDAWDKASKQWEGKPTEEVEQEYLKVCRGLGWGGDKVTAGESVMEGSAGGGSGMGMSVSVIARDEDEQKLDDSLHGAVVRDDVNKVKQMLDVEGVDIDALDSYGYTPLHLAADRGHLAIVKVLLDKGANIGVKDSDGETAISLSKSAGHEEITLMLQQWLLNKGRDGQDV